MLNLSQTTVSRALNGYPEVGEDTRRRVMEAALKTGYRPNLAAKRLATGKAASIGLIMPVSEGVGSDPHFGEFLEGLSEVAVRHDFHFVIAPAAPNDEVNALRRLVSGGSVDAVFVAYVKEEDARISYLKTASIPYLVHGRLMGDTHDYPFLDVDNARAFHQATKFLLQLGHKRIALINGPEEMTFAIMRRQGLEQALSEQGLTLPSHYAFSGRMTDRVGLEAMTRMLDMPERPTAILCASTALALGAVRAINKAGLTIGEDVSIIAHDDVLPFLRPENFNVPLTTTRSSLRAAGVRIADRLIARVHGGDTFPEQELWEVELIVRASTGPAPVNSK
ncbi:LacI family DNA-binding transcriptional regulator [Rhizobium sp. L1K21]|nr:LacI family DNA-binding transcriptional regulator [Rhizobium sp. L1K21]